MVTYMRLDLKHILQERFSGHEADVDPGLWNSIQSELVIAGAATDPLLEPFRQELRGHEADVDPGLWDAISSQIGQGAMAGTTAGAAVSGSGVLGWAAAGLGVFVVAAGVYLAGETGLEPAGSHEVAVVRTQEPEAAVEAEEVPVEEEGIAPARDPSPGTDPEPPAEPPTRTNAAAPPVSTVHDVGHADDAVEHTQPPPAVGSTAPTGTDDMAETDPQEVLPEQAPAGYDHAGAGPTPIEDAEKAGLEVVKVVIDVVKEEAAREERGPAQVSHSTVTSPEAPPATPPQLPDIFLANTFTPNGDGVNDTYIVDKGEYEQMVIQIFNLDHRLVFRTETAEPWDGASQPSGYYVVVVQAISMDGRLKEKSKMVWLNRDHY
jgi:hypothetical protein